MTNHRRTIFAFFISIFSILEPLMASHNNNDITEKNLEYHVNAIKNFNIPEKDTFNEDIKNLNTSDLKDKFKELDGVKFKIKSILEFLEQHNPENPYKSYNILATNPNDTEEQEKFADKLKKITKKETMITKVSETRNALVRNRKALNEALEWHNSNKSELPLSPTAETVIAPEANAASNTSQTPDADAVNRASEEPEQETVVNAADSSTSQASDQQQQTS